MGEIDRRYQAALAEIEQLKADNEALRADWPLYEHLRAQVEAGLQTAEWINKSLQAERTMADNAAAVIDALLNRQRTARIEAEQWLNDWREAHGQ